MNSLDTNILIYAVNADCPEHSRAAEIYQSMLDVPEEWILSDQILFEFYRALRNSRILERPLGHQQALDQITFLREKSGVQHCAYETAFWPELYRDNSNENPMLAHTFDRVRAATLKQNGVTCFYPRNTKDFTGVGFERLINPIDR